MTENNTMMALLDSVEIQQVSGMLKKISTMQTTIQKALVEGHDYGQIPGTNKPTLLKPGAEKILMMFGLTSEYEIIKQIEDYDKGLFAYNIRCTLSKGGEKITEGLGSCNSREKKYKYRTVWESKLPAGVDTRDLKQVGNGKYQVENEDICDLANTILKMAKKRAQIDAVLTVASLSEIFTQDVEDLNFMQAESVETMTPQDAENYRITFGKKHKGQTLGEIARVDRSYLEWLVRQDRTAPELKKACQMVLQGGGRQARPEPRPEPKEEPKDYKGAEEEVSQGDFFEDDFTPIDEDKVPF